jgi:outer membrane protein assembly factor BamD (BamD/ComL family)
MQSKGSKAMATYRARGGGAGGRLAGRLAVALALLVLTGAPLAHAARAAKVVETTGGGDVEARRLLDKAEDLLKGGEKERAVKMLETIIEQYPASRVRYAVYLTLGRHLISAHEQGKAIAYLANLKALEVPGGEIPKEDREIYLEGTYLTGVAYFQIRNYAAAFPILRKITTNYPNTSWANQAYFYIGMCHFVQQNWSKAIEALNLVGTFIDLDSPVTSLVEAGHRLYIKVHDDDLPVLQGLGKKTWAEVTTSHGDREKVECVPLGREGTDVVGSIGTAVGVPAVEDRVLQVLGGDTITVKYIDLNTEDGSANIGRTKTVRIVSTGSIVFTLGNFENPATTAYLDQPLFLALRDVDLDTSDAAEVVTVKVSSRYREQTQEDARQDVVDLKKALDEAEDPTKLYRTRDEVTVQLVESGAAPVHSGKFVGKVMVQAAQPDKPVNNSDHVLSCMVNDEILVSYVDELHIGGTSPRVNSSQVTVAGEIDNHPRISQDHVADPTLRSRKDLVEASAYLELARIFKSMGLVKGAKLKAGEGLDRTKAVISIGSSIPLEIKQQALKTMWELQIASDDLRAAIETCSLFNKLYPESPMVDDALMGIAKARLDNREIPEAISVLQQILRLPKSQVKAEAQFLIADAIEKNIPPGSTADEVAKARESAIQNYKLCADRYPESEFAGMSLAKIIDWHVEQKNFAVAGDLLVQIFQDYPDAPFLDSMLLKWVLVSFSQGDYNKARDKCNQLLFEYPGSAYAEKARSVLPKIDAKLKSSAGEGEGAGQ